MFILNIIKNTLESVSAFKELDYSTHRTLR